MKWGGNESFAVGHLAIGYIVAKLSTSLVKTKFNIPIILLLSIIPDLDFLIPLTRHGGPSHSTIIVAVVFIPIFAIYGKRTVPYFLAVVQHALLGDYFGGGKIQLFWPITSQYYGSSISSSTIVLIEWLSFVFSLTMMFRSGDIARLFKPQRSNLMLAVPTVALLFPILVGYPLMVPVWLIPPHLGYLLIFVGSMMISIAHVCPKRTKRRQMMSSGRDGNPLFQ